MCEVWVLGPVLVVCIAGCGNVGGRSGAGVLLVGGKEADARIGETVGAQGADQGGGLCVGDVLGYVGDGEDDVWVYVVYVRLTSSTVLVGAVALQLRKC